MIFQKRNRNTSETRKTYTGNLATHCLTALCWFSSYIRHLGEKNNKQQSKITKTKTNKQRPKRMGKWRKIGGEEVRWERKKKIKNLFNKIPIVGSIPVWTRVLDSSLFHASSTKLSVTKLGLLDPLCWQWLNWTEEHSLISMSQLAAVLPAVKGKKK